MTSIVSTRPARILLVAVLLFAGSLRLALLNLPFQRHAEGCAAFFGLVARNYFRYDFASTHGLPVMSMGQGAPIVFYANHPPTTPLMIVIVYALMGYHGEFDHIPADWQVRLPTALFTLACIALTFELVRRRANDRAAVIAAAIFATIPMTLIFGGFPDVVSPQLVFFAMLTVAAYERFHDSPNWRNALLLGLAFTGAGIVDWPAYFLVPVLAGHFVLTRPPRQWVWIIGFGIFAVALFVLVYAHATLGQTDWKWMVQQLRRRSLSSATDSLHQFTLNDWIEVAIWKLAIGRHTLVVIILAILWLITASIRRFSAKADRLVGLLLAWAAVHVLIGKQGVYMHEWWWWPLTPGVVMAAGVVFDQILASIHERWRVSIRATNIVAVIAIVIFTCWNVASALPELVHVPPMIAGPLDYTLAELGQTIRENVRPNGEVMIADSDQSLAFWHYADRAMKRSVWDLGTFQATMQHPTADLTFDLPMPWKGPVTTMIIPRAFLEKVIPPFVAYLDEHYPRMDSEKFAIWDLTGQLKPSTQKESPVN